MGTNTQNGFIEYRHIHTGMSGHPAVTFKVDVDQNVGSMKVSFASCSPEDNFSRAVGRDVSTQRMDTGEYMTIEYDRGMSINDNILNHLNDIMEERLAPPTNLRIMELARAYFYCDHVFYINEVMEAASENEDNTMDAPSIVTLDTSIIGA